MAGPKPLLPKYSRFPLALVLIINFLAYSATRLVTHGFVHYNLSLPLDSQIPFIPAFSLIYVLAFVQWVVGFILIARDSRELCYKVLSGEIIAKLICMVIYIIVPTTMTRPEITGSGFLSDFVQFIYKVDTPDNLLPSLHCFESWLCFRGAMWMKSTGKGYKYFSFVFTLLVFASTVLVKQHVVIDIVAGVLVCELGQFIAEKTNSARFFEYIAKE